MRYNIHFWWCQSTQMLRSRIQNYQPIEGLFAAGEMVGGISISIIQAAVGLSMERFGKIAGEAAGKHAVSQHARRLNNLV